jgi:hypothetical protein
MFGGSFRKLGTESNGISGAGWGWADRAIGTAIHSVRARTERFTDDLLERFDVVIFGSGDGK